MELQALEPIGTFEGQASRPGDPVRVVLMTDATAHLEELAMCRLGLFCPPNAYDALYTRSGPGSGGHLDFTTQAGRPLSGYTYQYDGTQLGLVRDGETEPLVLDKAPVAWCSVEAQCDKQLLPTPLCPGQWSCVKNTCQFACGAGIFVAPP